MPNFNKIITEKFYHEILNRNNEEQLARYLGIQFSEQKAYCLFWHPDLAVAKNVSLIFYRFAANFNLEQKEQIVDCQYFELEILKHNNFFYGVYEGVKAGTETQFGDFYALTFVKKNGEAGYVNDPLAASLPLGAFAPAEVFDLEKMFSERKDKAYFEAIKERKTKRLDAPKHILEIHIPTATEGGTIADLNLFYQNIFTKKVNNQSLTGFEMAMSGYGALELMPLQPQLDVENSEPKWHILSQENGQAKIKISNEPITQNWGYDIVIAGSSAVNPYLLKSKRPNEFLNFIETCHAYQTKVILDVVYGHADNPSVKCLDSTFIAGDGMYGKTLNYKHPMVRAILLETQRRMANYGIDGFRVDASQDINIWDNDLKQHVYDDAYIKLMHDVKATVEGFDYQPYMIYEDGRPWPVSGWALKQTYTEVTDMLPDAVQWGPLTFADNNPHLFNFWNHKMYRIEEIARQGARWVTGSSNHDSVRKGANVNPYAMPINTFFGDSLNEIITRGYHSPATKLLEYFLPGIPMDFAQAVTYSPWLFMRNTDWQWGVKVMSEEAFFIDWYMNEKDFKQHFSRLQSIGFQSAEQMKVFLFDLRQIILLTDYDWKKMVKMFNSLNRNYPKIKDDVMLRSIGKAYLTDAHDFCKITNHASKISEHEAHFFLSLRQFRNENAWLNNNFSEIDTLNKIVNNLHSTVYKVERTSLDKKRLVFIGNMEGETVTIQSEGKVILQTPKVKFSGNEIILKNGEGVLFENKLV
jgi:glycosidase